MFNGPRFHYGDASRLVDYWSLHNIVCCLLFISSFVIGLCSMDLVFIMEMLHLIILEDRFLFLFDYRRFPLLFYLPQTVSFPVRFYSSHLLRRLPILREDCPFRLLSVLLITLHFGRDSIPNLVQIGSIKFAENAVMTSILLHCYQFGFRRRKS